MDLLQEAFIHPPELCEARFIMEVRFIWCLVDCSTETPADCNDNAWKSQDNF